MECTAKHTKYNPAVEEIRCPRCDAEYGDFYEDITDIGGLPESGCDLMHFYAEMIFVKCGYGISGQAFANRLAKKKNLVPCAHCNGNGMVSKKAGA